MTNQRKFSQKGQAHKMAQEVKVPVAKTGNMILLPWSCMSEEKINFSSHKLSSGLHTNILAHIYVHIYAYKISKCAI